jgi:hypothetical protein
VRLEAVTSQAEVRSVHRNLSGTNGQTFHERLFMKLIEAQLMPDKRNDEQGQRNATGKSNEVYRGISFVLQDVPCRGFKEILQHVGKFLD